jgi:hypothetical protein
MKFVVPVFRQALEIEGVRRRIRRVVEGESIIGSPSILGHLTVRRTDTAAESSEISTDRHRWKNFPRGKLGVPGKCFVDDKKSQEFKKCSREI